MTNVEARPSEVVCSEGDRHGIQLIEPRDVPLGGLRAMNVRRTLPSRARSLIGAWCFLDHYGPDAVADTGGMTVTAHPHTGLQTVSWLFEGEVEHRDSVGSHAMVRPGEVNLMTAGRGISHSEISTEDTDILHGAQLWVALPDDARHTDPAFEHYAPDAVNGDGWQVRVFLGSLLGDTSPVTTFTPLLGAELVLDAGTRLEMSVDPSYELGVLVDTGAVSVESGDGTSPVARDELAYVPPGSASLTLKADEASRLLVLGGPPFGESIIMWWNYVGRSHDEVVAYREEWQAQVTGDDGEVVSDAQLVNDGRFGRVVGDTHAPIPAPALPHAQLRPRS